MNKLSLTFSLLILGGFLCAQTPPEWTWALRAGGSGTYHDEGKAITTDASGNIFVTGSFSGSATFGSTTLTSVGARDIFIAKLDPAGNWLWAIKVGNSGQDMGNGIATDAAGNCYVTGSFTTNVYFGIILLTSAGSYDVFVAKLDTNGNWLWATRAGASGSDVCNGLCTDASGNSYVTGNYSGTATFGSLSLPPYGNGDAFISKLDANGNWLWARRAGGASDYDAGLAIAADGNGNCFATGYFGYTASFGNTSLTCNGWSDIFVTALDSAGNWLWARGAGAANYDYGYSIATDSGGNCYVAGSFMDTVLFGTTSLASAGQADIFAAELNAEGNWLWAVRAGSTGNDYAYGISATPNGSCWLTGYYTGTVLFGADSITSAGAEDVFVSRLDQAGNWLGTVSAGGGGFDMGIGLKTLGTGDCLISGSFSGTATFGATTLVSGLNRDIFIAKLASGEDETVEVPQNLQISATDSGVQLSWDAVTGAAVYHIYAWDDPLGDYEYLLYTYEPTASFTWAEILALGYPGGADRAFFRVTADTAAP